jgi:hypothetical protein
MKQYLPYLVAAAALAAGYMMASTVKTYPVFSSINMAINQGY